VLVDSPPVAAVTDALLLAQNADATILVVQQNKVDRTTVKRALGALRKVTPNVVGAVLNAVDIRTKGDYGYGYYGYGYYGSRQDRSEKSAARRPRPEAATRAAEVTNASKG
jgi:Mrp family chromosome partitioning ATPase